MGAPGNIDLPSTPRNSIPPIELIGTPRSFALEDAVAVMTPKTPATPRIVSNFEFLTKSALFDAVERGDESEVSNLIDLEVNVNETYVCNVTPLIVATKNGNEEIVEKLLDAGAEVDKKDGLGRTSLMWACIAYPQYEFVVWRLLNAGASRDGTNFGYGMSAKISALLREFDSGLLLPRDSSKTLALMESTHSKIHPNLLKIIVSFLTLTLPSLKKTMY